VGAKSQGACSGPIRIGAATQVLKGDNAMRNFQIQDLVEMIGGKEVEKTTTPGKRLDVSEPMRDQQPGGGERGGRTQCLDLGGVVLVSQRT